MTATWGPDAGRYSPPTERAAAVELVAAAFVTAAAHRVNTPPAVTLAQGVLALRLLGVTDAEVEAALKDHELARLEWCGRTVVHEPHPRWRALCLGEAAAAPRPDGHVLLVHPPGHHRNDDGMHCMFCEGGLSACVRCGAFEGAWPDECPGVKMTGEQSDAVYAGTLNYRDGAWRPGECCRIRRPAEEALAEAGYRLDESGRWSR